MTGRARIRVQLATAGLGLAIGWNVTNIGAVADDTAKAYGITLGVVGLFTTVLFVVHSLMQVPSGTVVDRFGSRRTAAAAVLCLIAANAVAAVAADAGLALVARGAAGVGTGLGVVAGIEYVRRTGGSALAQGVFGGIISAGGGLALAILPTLEGSLGWRAPFVTALVTGAAALVALAVCPPMPARPAVVRRRTPSSGCARSSSTGACSGSRCCTWPRSGSASSPPTGS